MTRVFRETFASFHRSSAESDARLWSEVEQILAPVDRARDHLNVVQDRAFHELVRVLSDRQRYTEEEITEGVHAVRQGQHREGGW